MKTFVRLHVCIFTLCLALVHCKRTDDPVQIGIRTQVCLDRDEIPVAEHTLIADRCQHIIGLVHSDEVDQIYELSDARLRASIDVSQFRAQMNSIQMRIPANTSAELIDMKLIEVSGKFQGTVACGSVDPDNAAHVAIPLGAENESVAVVLFESPGDPMARVIAIQLRKTEERWNLSAIHVSDSAYNGKSASDYADHSEAFAKQGDSLGQYLSLLMAANLSKSAPFWVPSQSLRYEQDLKTLFQTTQMQQLISKWITNDGPFTIIGVSLISTLSDITPHVKYLSHGVLEEQQIGIEAEFLAEYVRTKHPSFNICFENVLFDAYEELPVDPQKKYSSFRVVKKI